MELLHIMGAAPLYTNTFLILNGAGQAIAIDPAANSQKYLDVLAERKAALTHILLTHGHYDHVGAVRALAAATGAAVWMDEQDAGGNTLFPLRPAEITAGWPAGEQFELDGLTFRLWHTPGHTKGSVCLLCEGNLFTGDTMFAGSCGRTDMPGGSMRQMMESLSLLAELPLPDGTRVLPGHEGFSTLGAERKYNPYLRGDVF